jgi:hypothetical protein
MLWKCLFKRALYLPSHLKSPLVFRVFLIVFRKKVHHPQIFKWDPYSSTAETDFVNSPNEWSSRMNAPDVVATPPLIRHLKP